MKWGQLVKKKRKVTGLTGPEFIQENKLNIGTCYLSKIETSESLPSIQLSIKIADILGIDQDISWSLLKQEMLDKFAERFKRKCQLVLEGEKCTKT